MNYDGNGIIYYNESHKGEEVLFHDAPKRNKNEISSKFYELINHPELLIKYSLSNLDDEKVRYMLRRFIELEKKIKLTNLPTSYYQENNELKGIVIPYYKNGISLYTLMETHSLDELMKYYKHDDDYIHNFYLLLEDILDIIEELSDNNVYYFDTNPGNFVIKDNQVHLIDFDAKYIKYEVDKKLFRKLLLNYDELVFLTNKRFELCDLCAYKPKNFEGMRKHLVKVENRVMKGR